MVKNRMLMRFALLLLGLLLVAASSAFVVHRALAGVCFVDIAEGSFWYNVTCWMYFKGISTGYPDGTFRPDNPVTRGEMALFLQRAFTNPSMVTYINTGPSAWIVNSEYSPPAYVEHHWSYTKLRSPIPGTYMYSMSPSLPSSMFRTMNYISGIQLCVQTADYPYAYVAGVDIYHVTYDTSGYHVVNAIVSTTDLTATGCYVYNFTTPGSFWGRDQLTVNVWGQINADNKSIGVSVVTVIIQPSTQFALLGDDADLLNQQRFIEPVDSLNNPSLGK